MIETLIGSVYFLARSDVITGRASEIRYPAFCGLPNHTYHLKGSHTTYQLI